MNAPKLFTHGGRAGSNRTIDGGRSTLRSTRRSGAGSTGEGGGLSSVRDGRRCRPGHRRGFSLVEVLIAITISATLLSAIMAALDASFRAYQSTTESASRHTMARLTMHRLIGLIRTGTDFGPFPLNVLTDPIITSDFIEFETSSGLLLRVEYVLEDEAFVLVTDPGGPSQTMNVLMSGVTPQYDLNNERILPFTLQYGIGPKLYRATVDFLIEDDPDIDLGIEGDDVPPLRLVGSTMPRNNL